MTPAAESLARIFSRPRDKSPSGRLLIIAAHPDDEIIGAGVLISRVRRVVVCHATDGAPLNMADARSAGFSTREEYSNARKLESFRALARAGIRGTSIRGLNFVDQQTAFRLEDLTREILRLFEKYRPDLVLTHAYEGGHPDHDSVAFACKQAAKLRAAQPSQPEIGVCEFTGYHGAGGWLQTYEFLSFGSDPEYRFRLSEDDRRLKIAMLRDFETQARTLEPFLLPQFECFRAAPDYDFLQPPHEGKLYYENFDWGISGASWRNLARHALSNLRVQRLAS